MGRGKEIGEHDEFQPPLPDQTEKHWGMISTYLENLATLKATLKPMLEKIAIKNTIIVMVCNFGQSALLMNFVCSSKSRGFDLSNVLVFATDRDTLMLAESLGLTAYLDEKNFGGLPSAAAQHYGDDTFTAMMYAKVVAVQIVNHLGYDLLFQDVDMHWYRNPLEVFHDETSPLHEFDMLFQDDGARSVRYTPWSANSGFYYVRHNDRTRYLLNCLLMEGDMIMRHSSHQQILIALIVDHVSKTGLRVKVLGNDEYPGGFDYNRVKRWDAVYRITQSSTDAHGAQIFHMSWTKNKDQKLKFLKQMGMWHLREKCAFQPLEKILGGSNEGNNSTANATVIDTFEKCCSREPLISCYYMDMPSVTDCSGSEAFKEKRYSKSYWATVTKK